MAVPTTFGDATAPSVAEPAAAEPAIAKSVTAKSVTAKSGTATPQADLEEATQSASDPARPWITIVWNDPINLMSYVTHVLMEVFGYPKTKAEKLMMDVHVKGRAVVSAGTRERMELDVNTLHGYGLWATLQQDD